MGRGGRGSGGGRSSGGGGGHRSSGGRMSSGGRSGRSSFSSGPRRSGYRPPPARPIGWRPRHTTHVYHHGGGNGCGCSLPFLFFCVVLIVVLILPYTFFSYRSGGSSDITKSTVEREPLEASAVITTDYYHDELGWIRSASKLESGMRSFFKETGVQPFLYITDTVNGSHYPTADDMDTYANDLYDIYIEDEGHILVLFFEYEGNPGVYNTWYVCGSQAKTVMDQEACDILLDYIDSYYYSNLDEDEMFSTAFEKAGGRIMTVTKSPLPMILVAVCVVVVVIIAFSWWKKAKQQRNLEAEQTERILNADLDTISKTENASAAENLEGKYSS